MFPGTFSTGVNLFSKILNPDGVLWVYYMVRNIWVARRSVLITGPLDDKMCIVCMEDLSHADHITNNKLKPKRLPCNHMLHLGCLKS
ncbi:LADA_0D02784g1_1 [Lachancea dasiensis]|uniref:LADA_0D02784g1_1 n=1 Tax=Lachancea dasiensis TaxID=1072105 RepID=A0A1G4J4Z9_9SACH|nr:LADA_0D02784g1_1 [Lachancea dasiensis]